MLFRSIIRINVPGFKRTFIPVSFPEGKKIVDIPIRLTPSDKVFDDVVVTAESKTKKNKTGCRHYKIRQRSR